MNTEGNFLTLFLRYAKKIFPNLQKYLSVLLLGQTEEKYSVRSITLTH